MTGSDEAPELPEGITEWDGAYYAVCCGCGKDDPLVVDLEELPRTGYRHYCFGSVYCTP